MFKHAASPSSDRPWFRHELLRLAPESWDRTLASRPNLAAVPLLATWVDNGWPVVVRRRVAGECAEMVPIGVPLPPSAGKLRIALAVPKESVLVRSSPPSLWTVRHAVDRSWQSTIRALVMLGARHAVTPAAFGSLLWQYQTGLCYLSPRSDLDLLWRAHEGYEISYLLTGIAEAERNAPMRIDGEIVFPNGAAVNWRELHRALNHEGVSEVITKSIEGVRLTNTSQLLVSRRVA
jgi:phosphoribosyl-dephospho-CoA transferase